MVIILVTRHGYKKKAALEPFGERGQLSDREGKCVNARKAGKV